MNHKAVRILSWVHLGLTVAWILAMIPSLIWWRNSVPWLVFMSVWANIAGSAASWQAARGEVKQADADTSGEEGRAP